MKLLVTSGAALALALVAAACGSTKIQVANNNPLHAGALLFNQRCSGCHSLSYAATYGSAANVRSAQFNNGPNFNVRCERPVNRVLYAIENGGFSGQIMPQNIVVGEQAREVAEFVAAYAGRQAPSVPGAIKCDREPVGTLLAANQTTATSAASSSSTTSTTSTTAKKPAAKKPAAKKPAAKKPAKKKK